MKNKPAVYGTTEPQKETPVSLANSKWLKPSKNQWREVTVSEDWLRNSISQLLQQHRYVKSSGDVDRVILSEPTQDGAKLSYKLTYSVSRKEV